MWFKKAYYEDQEDAGNAVEMIDIFRLFYNEELRERPKCTIGLAMFSPHPLGFASIQYFYSKCPDIHSHFFKQYDIEPPKIDPIIEDLYCIEGDRASFPQAKKA